MTRNQQFKEGKGVLGRHCQGRGRGFDPLRPLQFFLLPNFTAVKAQYLVLVKCHHPDANNDSRVAEEKFKNITRAFTVLKELFGEKAA